MQVLSSVWTWNNRISLSNQHMIALTRQCLVSLRNMKRLLWSPKIANSAMTMTFLKKRLFLKMKKGQPYSDSTWEHLFRSAKIFPWLTFNFRLRTGHKSDRSYSATKACCSCRESCYKAQQVAMAVQQCEICSLEGKKCSYLVRMPHPSNHSKNLLTPGLLYKWSFHSWTLKDSLLQWFLP